MVRSGIPTKDLGRYLEIQSVVLRQRRDLRGDIGRTGPIARRVGRLEDFQIGRPLRGSGVIRVFIWLCVPRRHLEAQPAGERRAKINLILAATEIVHRHGSDFLSDAVQRGLLGHRLAFRRLDLHRVLPILVVEIGIAPIRNVCGRIHAFAAEIAPNHASSALIGTRRAFPTRIGSQCPRLAVDFRLDLRAHMWQGRGDLNGCRIRPGRHPPPHPQPDGVATGLQKLGDIVGVVKNLLRVVGDRRRQHIGADFLPIDVKLRVTGDIDSHKRTRRHGGEVERLPQPRRGVQVGVIMADPLSEPTCGLESSHPPKSQRAPLRRLLLAVGVDRPGLHLPVAKHPRREWFSLIFDVDALAGVYLAAVPEIALIFGEDFRR